MGDKVETSSFADLPPGRDWMFSLCVSIKSKLMRSSETAIEPAADAPLPCCCTGWSMMSSKMLSRRAERSAESAVNKQERVAGGNGGLADEAQAPQRELSLFFFGSLP